MKSCGQSNPAEWHLKLHSLALCIAYAPERQISLAELAFLQLYWPNEVGACGNEPHLAGHTQGTHKANGHQLEALQSTWDPAGPETGSLVLRELTFN